MCMCISECIHLFKGDDDSHSNLQMEAVLHFEETSIMSPAGAPGSSAYSHSAQLTRYQLLTLPVTIPELAVIPNFMVCGQQGTQTMLKLPRLMSLQAVKHTLPWLFI